MDQVGVDIVGHDHLTGPATQATTGLGRLGQAANQAGSPLGTLGRVAHATAGGLGRAAGQLRGLVTGPLGLLGLTGGLLGVTGALESTLSRINSLAFGTEKLTSITGDSAETMSTLVAVSEKYGIDLDKLTTVSQFYEKAVGKLEQAQAKGTGATKSAALASLELQRAELVAEGRKTKTIDLLIREQKARDQIAASHQAGAGGLSKLEALEKQYGVRLTDNTGKALTFIPALLNVADVYAKSEDKAKAAALAATLFGKSYGTLSPILALGKQGIMELQAQAAQMGLQLDSGNIAQFKEYRDAVRESQEAIAGLQVAIGTDLLPTIIDAARAVTGFITVHKTDIVHTVDGLIAIARTAAGTIGNLVGAISTAWDAIPAPAKTLLIAAVAGDRTLHWLFGFSPIHLVVQGIENAFTSAVSKGVGGSLAKTLFGGVQKVWVVNMGPGGLGGPGGAAGAAEGGLANFITGGQGWKGALKSGLAVALATAAVGQVIETYNSQKAGIANISGNIAASNDAMLANSPSVAALKQSLDGINQGIDQIQSNPLNMILGGDALQNLKDMKAKTEAQLAATMDVKAAIVGGAATLAGAVRANTAKVADPPWLKRWEHEVFGQHLRAGIVGAEKNLLTGHDLAAAAAFLAGNVGTGGKGGGGLGSAQRILGELTKALDATTDPSTRHALVDAINRIEKRLPTLESNTKNLHAAEAVAASAESQDKKLSDLNAILADVRAHGDRLTRQRVEALITAVKTMPPPHVTVTVPVTVFPTKGGGTTTVRATRSTTGTTYAGKAGGGPVWDPVWVGERGPELFDPGGPGQIIPHELSRMRTAYGGGAGGLPPGLIAELIAVLRQLAKGWPKLELEARSSSRDTSAAQSRSATYGDNRARQMAY